MSSLIGWTHTSNAPSPWRWQKSLNPLCLLTSVLGYQHYQKAEWVIISTNKGHMLCSCLSIYGKYRLSNSVSIFHFLGFHTISHLESLQSVVKHPSGHTRRQGISSHGINSLWPNDAIWRQRTESTLAQVMACCLTAPSHYLNQCWLIISKIQFNSSDGNFTRDTSVIND